MHHRALNNLPQLHIFVAATLAMMVVTVAAYFAMTFASSSGKTTAVEPSRPGLALPVPISEDEANSLVWSLPEVQAGAEQLRSRGSRPITYTSSKPFQPGETVDRQGVYVINFAEDRNGQVTTLDTFSVDARTGRISVYDVVEDTTVSLEQWRAGRLR